MSEPRMPTSLPSPVDRAEFRFVAVDATGAAWEWADQEMGVGPGSGRGRRGWGSGRQMRPCALTGAALATAIALTSVAETYRGIDVAPEHRCAPYDPRQLSLLAVS